MIAEISSISRPDTAKNLISELDELAKGFPLDTV